MDANLTRFHLLLGREDWASDTIPGLEKISSPPGPNLEWDEARHELRLLALPFRFRAAPRDDPPEQSDRRGAAADTFGNWFWISANGDEIRARSSGGLASSHFWSNIDAQPLACADGGTFQPEAAPAAATPRIFGGLAVTEDSYLVAGTLDPGGLFIFDLLGGGPPRTICWPSSIPFVPFDMVPRYGGGVWILDRENGRLWGLDRTLRVLVLQEPGILLEKECPEIFQPPEGELRPPHPERLFPDGISLTHASPIEAESPVAIEALPDGSVLVLDAPPSGTSRVLQYSPAISRKTLPFLTLSGVTDLDFRAFDFASAEGRLFIASAEGNQAFAFAIDEALAPIRDYFPMRRFGGKALVAACGRVYYDFGERWLPLVAQPHPQFATEATLTTRVFDGREPECVWHRLLLDACLPPGTDVEISSRVADDEDDVALAPWDREPPLYRRSTGSELPFTTPPASLDRGTFELLLQKARGRFLQLELRLSGDGRHTPRLRALRLYYPRFSYLHRYLPTVYREDPEPASFLDRFLANLEGTNTAIEDRIAAVQMLFDVRSAPPDALEWLASWFGAALDPAWDETRRRLFLAHAMEFFQWRGTVRGLKMALRLALEEEPDAHIFDPPGSRCHCGDRFRIIEKFLTRQRPTVELDDPAHTAKGPQIFANSGKWQPADGAGGLHVRYRAFTGSTDPFSLIPLTSADAEAARQVFARRELGFVPSDPTDEIAAWRNDQLRQAADVEPVGVPVDEPSSPEIAQMWRGYQASSASQPYGRQRRMWQQFLIRRYVSLAGLNQAHATHWSAFEEVAYPVEVPANVALLHDWVEYEAHVLPTLAAAHRFTVLLPVKAVTAANSQELPLRLALANRLIALEKPAHTVFDVKFFWAHFRVEEARLGYDTVLGLGGRDPGLKPRPAVLGESYLAESLVATAPPPSSAGRILTGRDRLPRQSKKNP